MHVNFLEIKPLTSELLPAVLELDRLCFGGLWTMDGYQRELASPNSDLLGLSIASLREGEQENFTLSPPHPLTPSPHSPIGIGCLWAILEEAHITLLGIHPDYRGQGLGMAMLHALLREATNRQLERATLEVRVSNHLAISLYQKFGFQEAGRRRRYYQDTDEDALILWRSGLRSPEFGQLMAILERQIGDRLALSGWNICRKKDAGQKID